MRDDCNRIVLQGLCLLAGVLCNAARQKFGNTALLLPLLGFDLDIRTVHGRQFSLPEQSGPGRLSVTLLLGAEASPALCVCVSAPAVVPAGGGIGGHFLGSFGNLLMPELGTGTDDELRGGRGGGGGSAAGSLQLHGTSPSEWAGEGGSQKGVGGQQAALLVSGAPP